MEQLAKIKDSVFGFFSPRRINTMPDPKRRHTIDLETPSKDLAGEHVFDPISEPRGEKAQVALYNRLNTKYISTSLSKNPLKRSREEDDDNEQLYEGKEDVEMSAVNSESISPEESPSQITPGYDDEEEEEDESEDEDGEGFEGEGEYDDDEAEEIFDEEATAREKVEEYLARQAELALKKDLIAEVKQQGTWHPDEVYLFERLSLRSFEPLIPQEWQIDFGTLPEDLFDENKDNVLINHNCLPGFHGKPSMVSLSQKANVTL